MKTLALLVLLTTGCGGGFIAFPDDGGPESKAPDGAQDSGGEELDGQTVEDAPDDTLDAGTDAVPTDTGSNDAAPEGSCVSGLWCALDDGGTFTPCSGGVNFTCGGNACDLSHCSNGDVCRALTGMGPDGSTYSDGIVTRCAP